METPNLTTEDKVGIASVIAVLGFAVESGDPIVQLAAVIGASLIGTGIVAAGAFRRGKRAEFIAGNMNTAEYVE